MTQLPSAEIIDAQLKGFVQIGSWINTLILLGAGLSLTVSVMKLSGGGKFKVGQLEFPLAQFVYVAAALTAAHAFLTVILFQRVAAIKSLDQSSMHLAWEQLVNSGGFVFYNMRPRVEDQRVWHTLHIYRAEIADTAIWFTIILALSLAASVILTWRSDAHLDSTDKQITAWGDRLAIGLGLAVVNWIIGSQWAIAVSVLKLAS
ncbi:hypothetical protein [Bradyrhizobium sp. OK095]|uniref:hypothetical protein n=1 Tax=Bradyrhizobium sp. OK095 TaxID=1882760 RepID=UPI000B87DF2E|nr:hypothetical protein [Bradyrhizobium sp. OK095]